MQRPQSAGGWWRNQVYWRLAYWRVAARPAASASSRLSAPRRKAAISGTAEFGALKGGERIVTADTRTEMRRILREVRSGTFVKELIADAEAGYPRLRASRTRAAAHPVEAVGKRIAALTGGAAEQEDGA